MATIDLQAAAAGDNGARLHETLINAARGWLVEDIASFMESICDTRPDGLFSGVRMAEFEQVLGQELLARLDCLDGAVPAPPNPIVIDFRRVMLEAATQELAA